MMNKFQKFLRKSTRDQAATILKTTRAGARAVSHFVLVRIVRRLFASRFGRDVIFFSHPNDALMVATTEEGLHYVVHAADQMIGRNVFCYQQSFDRQNLKSAVEILGKDKKILLDVGANIGTIGIFAVSQRLFSRCIAIEPDPKNFRLLRANVALNDVSECFDLHNCALSDSGNGTLDFELSEENFGDHRVRICEAAGRFEEQNRRVIRVEKQTLDALCQGVALDECVLFMDTQGHEGHVLAGALSLLRAGVPIVTEFWPYGLMRAEGLERFYKAIESGSYTGLYDLRYPDKRIEFSLRAIQHIADELQQSGRHTDLVLVRE